MSSWKNCTKPLLPSIHRRWAECLGGPVHHLLSRLRIGTVFLLSRRRKLSRWAEGFAFVVGGVSRSSDANSRGWWPPSTFPRRPSYRKPGESSKSEVPEPEERPLLEEAAPNRQIQELQNDPYLNRSYRNALIKQEEIIVVMTQLVDELGIHIADRGDIRKGVDIYFTDLMNKE